MAPWWWFLREPKHVGAIIRILIVLISLWLYNCVHHCGIIKSALILLMHGTNMKITFLSVWYVACWAYPQIWGTLRVLTFDMLYTYSSTLNYFQSLTSVNLLNDFHIVLLNTSTKGCFVQYSLSHHDNILKPAAYVILRSYLTSLLLSVVTNKVTQRNWSL
jgi:hypothetical protein